MQHPNRRQRSCCNKRVCAPDGGRVSILHAHQCPAEQMKLAVRAGGHAAAYVTVLGTELASSGATQRCLWWLPSAALPSGASNPAHQAMVTQSRRCMKSEQGAMLPPWRPCCAGASRRRAGIMCATWRCTAPSSSSQQVGLPDKGGKAGQQVGPAWRGQRCCTIGWPSLAGADICWPCLGGAAM